MTICNLCLKKCSGKIFWEISLNKDTTRKFIFCSKYHRDRFKLLLLSQIVKDIKLEEVD